MEEPEYQYLPGSPFHTNFQEAVGESAETYTVYVGIYSIKEAFSIDEMASKIPYLRFISVQENDNDQMIYTFPHFECTRDTFDMEYNLFMMKLFEQTATNEMPFTPKHILVNGNMALVMFSFEDMAKTEMFSNHAILSLNDSSPVLNMKWAIVDEIVFERNIMGVAFDTKISEFLLDHDSLWNIEYDSVYIDFPFSVYPVGESDGQLVNINSSVKKTDLYTLHEDYGDRYCFTYKPIGDTNEIIRYAIYTHDTKYVVEQNGMEQNGMEQNGMEQNGMEQNGMEQNGGDEVTGRSAKLEESELLPEDKSIEHTPTQESLESENSNTLSPDQTVTPSPEESNTPFGDQTNTPSMNNEEVSQQNTFTPSPEESNTPSMNNEEVSEPVTPKENESSEVPFVFPTQESNQLEKSNSEEATILLSIPTIYFYENLTGKKHSMWGILNSGQFTNL